MVAIIKHANPCGVAVSKTQAGAYKAALACDPVSAFGGIIASNTEINAETATEICKIFVEAVIAPMASTEALAIFAAKKNLRVLLTGAMPEPTRVGAEVKTVTDGLLVQERDNGAIDVDDLVCVTKIKPTRSELIDLVMAWKIAKHVKSNAIVYVKDGATAGIGAGQMSRVDAAKIASSKAKQACERAGWEQSAPLVQAPLQTHFFHLRMGYPSFHWPGPAPLFSPVAPSVTMR